MGNRKIIVRTKKMSQISKPILGSYAAVALPAGAMAMPIAVYLPPLYG